MIKTNKTDIAYPIKKGDTISKIAIKFGIDKDWIIKWNAIENEALIYPGEIIKLNLSELN
jgi:LysM repeat protein